MHGYLHHLIQPDQCVRSVKQIHHQYQSCGLECFPNHYESNSLYFGGVVDPLIQLRIDQKVLIQFWTGGL